MSDNLPTVIDAGALAPQSADALGERYRYISHVARNFLVPDIHYYSISEDRRPMLTRSGCEAICVAFQLAPKIDLESTDYPDGHRDYRATCTLTHIPTGKVVSSWQGECSTRESKYAFTNEKVITEVVVPQAFWTLHKRKKKGDDSKELFLEMQATLRDQLEKMDVECPQGANFGMKKEGGSWFITYFTGEKTPVDNIADKIPTCGQMAQTRAFRGAVRAGTGTSDIFGDEEVMSGGDANSISIQIQDGDAVSALRVIYNKIKMLPAKDVGSLLTLRLLCISAFNVIGLDTERLKKINDRFAKKEIPPIMPADINQTTDTDELDDEDEPSPAAPDTTAPAESEGRVLPEKD